MSAYILTKAGFLSVVASAAVLLGAGCGKSDKDASPSPTSAAKATTTPSPGHSSSARHIHKGAWCEEHGVWEVDRHAVKEKTCSLCMSDEDQEKTFRPKDKPKDKWDWCEKHERAKSQCFKCDPKLYDGFAAEYKKKFGVDPPRPPQEEFEDDKK
jgi:hypothetical protein